MNNIAFLHEHYHDQIQALNHFIADTYQFLPQQDRSLIRFGGGTALAIYYYQHRLSFDIDLFATDMQVLNYLSPKHWIDETNHFNSSSYIDLSHHIRVLEKKNNIKIDVLISQSSTTNYLVDDSKSLFDQTVYVENIEDIIAKKIVYRRNDNLTRDIIDIGISITQKDNFLDNILSSGLINHKDIEELYDSLSHLDKQTFDEELEIVAPFENYLNDAINAPEIIKQACQKILSVK